MLNFSHLDANVIVVDDEPSELEAYSFLLTSMGVKNITTVQDNRQLMDVLDQSPNGLVFLDLNMPHKSGEDVLAEIRETHPAIPVVICTANSDISMAVKCLKLGAHDYLVKPINMNVFGSALRNALEISSLRNEVMNLKGISNKRRLRHPQYFSPIFTQDPAMKGIFHYIESISGSGQPVLILGETGSGKELMARAIHDASQVDGEFVTIDVSGLDDTFFSDTLFGHNKGAYTGADVNRTGLIERARCGTLFLDEIGDLSPVSQIKLLRLLQEGVYYPLGSDQPKKSRARVVAAANKELNGFALDSDGFRKDLYYRLSTHLIRIPPLRERAQDIPLLAEHLARKAARGLGKNIIGLEPDLLGLLQSHPFPGNVRELKMYIYDAVAQCSESTLTKDSIKERIRYETKGFAACVSTGMTGSLESVFGRFPTLSQLTEFAVDAALEKAAGNQSKAAGFLGISKQAMSKRLKKRNQPSL